MSLLPYSSELEQCAIIAKDPCPDCGKTLRVRTAKDTGKPFVGCSQFPKCKWTSYKAGVYIPKD